MSQTLDTRCPTGDGWRWAGLGLGVVAAFLTANVDVLGLFHSLGRGVMLVPTVFGLCVIGGAVVGELATTSRREGVRTAALETRSVGDYLPRRLGGLVLTSTVGLGALLVTTTLMGTADDMGRAGRNLSRMAWTVLGYVLLAVGVLMLFLGIGSSSHPAAEAHVQRRDKASLSTGVGEDRCGDLAAGHSLPRNHGTRPDQRPKRWVRGNKLKGRGR